MFDETEWTAQDQSMCREAFENMIKGAKWICFRSDKADVALEITKKQALKVSEERFVARGYNKIEVIVIRLPNREFGLSI